MKSNKIFADFNGIELYEISKLFYKRQFSDEEVIFRQGEQGIGFYFVYLGQIQIEFEDGHMGVGRSDLSLKRGEFFGENAMFERGPVRDYTAKSIGQTELLGLFRPDIDNLIEDNPKLAAKLYKCFGSIINQKLYQIYIYLREKEQWRKMTSMII